LEQFGTSILQKDQDGGLKVILDQTVEQSIKRLKLEPKNQKQSLFLEVQTEIMD
jgi:hypothetical protein